MKLVVHEFMTLDGVIQGPGSANEDTSGGFENGGWGVPYFDDAVGRIVDSWFSRTAALLFGRTTYELMSAYWPNVTDSTERVARVLNGAPKYIVSKTLRELPWHRSRLLDGEDPIEAVRTLRRTPGGELQVHGCATLVQALNAAGLVDEFRIITFPIAVGSGKTLFPAGSSPSGFRNLESKALANGTTYVALQPEPFRPGAFVIQNGEVEAVV
jgi:dihydrofolate reductase